MVFLRLICVFGFVGSLSVASAQQQDTACKVWSRNGCVRETAGPSGSGSSSKIGDDREDGGFGGRQIEPPPVGGKQPMVPTYAAGGIKLSSTDKASLRETCRQKNCRVQSSEAIARKARTRDLRLQEGIAFDEADESFNDLFEAKKELLALNDLDRDIEPEDDGLWNGDIALNSRQAKELRRTFRALRRRKRASAMYFDAFPYNYKWKNPISYVFDSTITTRERDTIRSALTEIESKSCLHFDEKFSVSGEHIKFSKFSGSNEFECGQSPLGNQESVNNIYLDFNNCQQNMKGVVLHQVLHSLGMHHTQTRIGREKWVQIWWNNVDPQKYDSFYQADYSSFTTYGVPYDYFSVLHGRKTEKAVSPSLQTLKALKTPVAFFDASMGQREYLSSRDAEMIRKMYCQDDCTDTTVNCGYYYGLKYCDPDSGYADWMRYYCRKTCEWC